MNVLDTIFGAVQPQADAAATQAANAALDNIAQRPFNVVVTIDPTTRDWVTVLVIVAIVGAAVVRRL